MMRAFRNIAVPALAITLLQETAVRATRIGAGRHLQILDGIEQRLVQEQPEADALGMLAQLQEASTDSAANQLGKYFKQL